MRRKNVTVEMELHSELTNFLFLVNELYSDRNQELVITSGSESCTRHGYASLHYSGCAVDIRTKNGRLSIAEQALDLATLAKRYCKDRGIPANWFDTVAEKDHIHLEYQPKRPS